MPEYLVLQWTDLAVQPASEVAKDLLARSVGREIHLRVTGRRNEHIHVEGRMCPADPSFPQDVLVRIYKAVWDSLKTAEDAPRPVLHVTSDSPYDRDVRSKLGACKLSGWIEFHCEHGDMP